MRATRSNQGLTLIEIMVVVAIIGIASAMAIPGWTQFSADQRVRGAARTVSNAFNQARSQAIATGSNHIVYLGMGAGTDACGNALVDVLGNPVPVAILNDGPPGAGTNCCLDVGENLDTQPGVRGVNWGVSFAGAGSAADAGGGDYTTGSSFADTAAAQTRWVMFRPDGIPVGFSAACNLGGVGTGAGGVYLTNGNRDYAVVLTPLGAVKVHPYDRSTGAWLN